MHFPLSLSRKTKNKSILKQNPVTEAITCRDDGTGLNYRGDVSF